MQNGLANTNRLEPGCSATFIYAAHDDGPISRGWEHMMAFSNRQLYLSPSPFGSPQNEIELSSQEAIQINNRTALLAVDDGAVIDSDMSSTSLQTGAEAHFHTGFQRMRLNTVPSMNFSGQPSNSGLGLGRGSEETATVNELFTSALANRNRSWISLGHPSSNYRQLAPLLLPDAGAFKNGIEDGHHRQRQPSDWFEFVITECDGGSFGSEYSPQNIVKDDSSVYCSCARCNVNIVLARKSKLSDMIPAPFKLREITVRIPKLGYTCPLKNGFAFICSQSPKIPDFDEYNTIETKGILDEREVQGKSLPKVPSYVLSALYFQLHRESNEFRYKFQMPVAGAYFVLIKCLSSFGEKGSIDVEFIGLNGEEEKLCFPAANLR